MKRKADGSTEVTEQHTTPSLRDCIPLLRKEYGNYATTLPEQTYGEMSIPPYVNSIDLQVS